MFNYGYQKNLDPIFKDYPGCVYWVDQHGTFLGGNEYCLKLLQLSHKDELHGKTTHDLAYFKDKKSLADAINTHNWQVIHSSKPSMTEEQWLVQEQTVFFLSSRVPLWHKGGYLNGVLVIATEVTDYHLEQEKLIHKAEAAELTLDNIIANMPGHLYWKNVEGIYLGCNNRQARSLGFRSAADIIGKTDAALPWHGASAETFRENDLRIMETGNTEIFEEDARIEGKAATVLSQKTPLKNRQGKIIGVLGISIDITKLKETEHELILAKEMADDANRLKLDFIHNMEHDIRTPFTGIYGMAQVLASLETDPLKKSMLDDITNCAKELLDYNNGILDFSRIESGELPVLSKKFSINRLINKIIVMESPPAKIKNIDLSIHIEETVPDVIVGDRNRLQRILINLISNAIKFTHQGFVKIMIQLRKKDESTAIIRFIIEDTGIGIPEDKQQIIYETFTRLIPANQGQYKGHGLGLRIVKKFTDDLGGELDVTSKPNAGTSFYCTLPFRLPLTDDIIDEEESS